VGVGCGDSSEAYSTTVPVPRPSLTSQRPRASSTARQPWRRAVGDCQPVAAVIALMVAPSGVRGMAISAACLVRSRGVRVTGAVSVPVVLAGYIGIERHQDARRVLAPQPDMLVQVRSEAVRLVAGGIGIVGHVVPA